MSRKCLTCYSTMVGAHKMRRYCEHCSWVVKMFQKRAHAKVLMAIRRNQIPPAHEFQCVDCGAQATKYDHRDYSQPYTVDPVCNRCNGLRGPGNWPNGLSDIHYSRDFIGGL